jgi:putative transport protein
LKNERNYGVVNLVFNYHSWLLNPFVLIFASTLLGLLLGSITLGKFKFGVSGALFSGLAIGKYAYEFALGFSKTDL